MQLFILTAALALFLGALASPLPTSTNELGAVSDYRHALVYLLLTFYRRGIIVRIAV